jgi:hypothetical protein
MTNEEVVHFWPTNGTTPCGAPRRSRSTYVWSEVTCGECRLEQPMDRTGNPERKLAPAASAHILAERLAEVQEIEDRALGEIRHWTTLLADALAARNTLSARLSALEAPVVPEEASELSTPQKGAERRCRVLDGHRPGAEGVALRTYRSGGVEMVSVVLDGDSGGQRGYRRDLIEFLPQKSAERVSFRMKPGFETKDGHRYTSVPCEVPETWHRLDNEGPDRLWASGPYLIRSYPYNAHSVRYHVSRDVAGRLIDITIGDYHTIKAAKEFCKINARGEQVFNWA